MCTHISRNINLRNQIIKDKVDGTFAHYYHFMLGSVTVRPVTHNDYCENSFTFL